MKTIMVWLFILVAMANAGDYKKDWADLREKIGKEKLEAHLSDWRTREPENPDAWIHSANFALEQGEAVNFQNRGKGPLPEGNYELVEKDGKITIVQNGKEVGEVGPGGYNPEAVRKAGGYLVEALKKWPHRADIHCGLATIYARGDLWKEHIATLESFGAAAREQAGKLRWCHNEELGAPEADFVADKLHSFALRQFEQETKEGDARLFAIAKIAIAACPKSAKGYNDAAIYHGLTKNWKAAQPMLEKAAAVAPEDTLVWMNLGDNFVRLKDKAGARKAYQRVLDLNPPEELRADARKKLDELGKAAK